MEKDLGISIPVVENVPENAAAIKPPAELFIDEDLTSFLDRLSVTLMPLKSLQRSILT